MERVYVTIRSRPLSPEDAKSSPWRISANSISYQNNPSCKFEFDRIFGEECKTREVYEARTKEIVSAAVRGFNGTVFAYGQTNSGKTHTMRGSVNEPGIIPLAVHELFETIQEATDREFLLRMSYLEIYNEEINDLLAPQHRRLQIHESVERGIFVAGLSEEIVASPEQVLDLMEFGESHRHIGETNMNLYSSRSHTIFRMIIESRDRPEEGELENTCDAVRVSILNLVDLAGSERAAKTGAEGVRLKEGSHINKSLMTLGTVIKKLSEGAEIHGGHVPYRDSKLTRILQSSLGGNANTAIICNITLAQIHADETKSSLQFASRALRITNCAHVNEILTDAALLKRQKKEIEELRAKLQASHSEHLEEEILSLRNTLLQTELERERIALELEEEKRSQVERDKRLEEQAKRIKNLSSMVLNANRDETRERHKRDKRRDTWCPGKLILDSSREESAITISIDSIGEIVRPEREVVPLLPFGELIDESEAIGNLTSKQGDAVNDIVSEEITLDTCTLSKVTSRRKGPSKKKNILPENPELIELKADYEELLREFEAQRIMYEVEIDSLRRKIVEDNLSCHEFPMNFADNSIPLGDENIYPRDLEAIRVIKNLQDQIKELEREKSLSQQYFDNAVEIAKEQNFCAMQEREMLQKELTDAKLEAKLAHNQLPILEDVGNLGKISTDLISELLSEVEQISGEFQSFQNLVQSSLLGTDDLFQSYSSMLCLFSDLRSSVGQNLVLLKEISNDYQKQKLFFENKVSELVDEKLVMQNESASLYKQIDELTVKIQNSEKDLADVSEGHNLEKAELIDGLRHLEREVSCLSSSSLFREKESLRKDLKKTRAKLKDTESKLKNAIHDKTRIEGEKANAEREIKKLSNLNALLERDISRRESLAGRRRESALDKRSRGHNNDIQQTLEDYKNLEVLAFEMERTIASLEEELAAVKQENEDIASRNESLSFEMEVLSEKLSASNSELAASQDKTSAIMSELENSKISLQTLECKVQQILEEKEELAMQMTHAFLELEEERAIWSAKEKASVESITEKTNKYTGEIMSLSTELSTTRNEILSLKEECRLLQLKLKDAENDVKLEKMQSKEKSLEIDKLKHNLEEFQCQINKSEQLVKSKVDMLQLELEHVQMELLVVSKEREELQFRIKDCEQGSSVSNDSQGSLTVRQEEQNYSEAGVDCQQKNCVDNLMKAKSEAEELAKRCSDLEVTNHNENVENSKDRAKLRMRLRATQTKLDAFHDRYKEALQEQEIMDSKFKEASTDLKRWLASCATEVLNLKKQLVASGSTQVG